MYDRMSELNHHNAWGGAWWHVLVMVMVITLVTGAAWLILSRTLGRHGFGGQTDPAVSILRERFARSEITEEEYRSRLTLLQGKHEASA